MIGFEIIADSHVLHIFYVFGLCGMVFGSLSAIWENDIRRMISFSSVAQIGYIYMGFGIGIEAGVVASIFHIIAHAATKSLLFISAIGLTDVSGGSRHFQDLNGSAFRNKIAGIGFSVGCLSMVGVPLFSGFVSKILFAEAAFIVSAKKMFPVLIVLGISTILNAIYFLKTLIRIYTPADKTLVRERGYLSLCIPEQKLYSLTIILFICVNIFLGLNSEPMLRLILTGLRNFA